MDQDILLMCTSSYQNLAMYKVS